MELILILGIKELASDTFHYLINARNNCENKSLCEEKLSLVLPQDPPFLPREYGRCAIVGNSGDLLKMKLGKEIDGYDAVVRNNGAPVAV